MKTLKGEEWRDVIGYEGVYKVSNLGRVQRLKGYKCAGNRILRIKLNKGYPTLMLSKNGKTKRVSVHKLVTDAFIGPCPDGLEVNHIDHDRANARADNLEYCTRQRNIAYAVEQGRFRAGDRASLNSVIVKEIKELLRQGISVASIARNYGTSLGAISAIKSRRNWKYIE